MAEDTMELNLEQMDKVVGGATTYGGYKTKPPKKSGCKIYQIQKGDTLGGIARAFDTTVEELMVLNQGAITNYNKIMMGWYIYVPRKKK